MEIDGTEYSIVVTPSSPFTLESAFGSAPIRRKDGHPVSDDELEAIIDRAKEEHAAHLIMNLNDAYDLMKLLDSNIFLRYFDGSATDSGRAAYALFHRIENGHEEIAQWIPWVPRSAP